MMNNINKESDLEEPCTPKFQLALSAEIRNVINERNVLTKHTKRHILSALEEVHNTNVEIEQDARRTEIIKEIISSEKSYLHQLNIIKDYFMTPLQEKQMLKRGDFDILFGSIQPILNINERLFKHLHPHPENIGRTFLKMAPYLKLYSIYAYNYKNCMNVLQKVTSTNAEFSKFLEHQESRPEVQKKLTALLIIPIQRVPRYRLLLKQLVDNTTNKHSFFILLQESLSGVELSARHINNFVEENENMQKLIKIQQSLQNSYPSIITPGRKLIKEGLLMRLFNNNERSKQQFIVLMSDILMCCKLKKENPDLLNSLKISVILPLNKCRITEMLNKGAFKIICEEDILTFHHHSAENIKEWISIVTETISNYRKNKFTLRKDFSYRKPAYKAQINQYQDVGISPGKRRRKRRFVDNENQNAVYFPLEIQQHKSFHDTFNNVNKRLKYEARPMDVLFPLRARNGEQNKNTISSIKNYSKNDISNVMQDSNHDLFIFGENNQPRGFRWTASNIFTILSNSFKKIFTFKQS